MINLVIRRYRILSLVTSLIISDGIVIAGDSLSTTQNQVKVASEVEATCPDCGKQHTIEPELEANFPASTFSFAQKVFPFMDWFGVGAVGQGQIAGKTVHFAIKELEKRLREQGTKVKNIDNAADIIGDWVKKLIRIQVEDIQDGSLEEVPDDWSPITLQVVGYDNTSYEFEEGNSAEEVSKDDFAGGKIIELQIGKRVNKIEHPKGCSVSGQHRVVDAIWELYNKYPKDQAAYEVFSLQDAIDYAEFLIGTTKSYQRFSHSFAGVGGKIDIGLVTPFQEFRWIKRKKLTKALEKGKENNDEY